MTLNKSMKLLAAAALLATAQASFAQAAAAAPVSAAKKELVAKLVQLQQPSCEGTARTLVQPALTALMQAAGAELQKMPADKRDPIAKSIEADVRKFAEEIGPQMRDRGQKLGALTSTPILEERFAEDELKQVIAWLESPISRKYQQNGAEMMNALGQKLAVEMRPVLEPRFKALEQNVAKQLGVTPRPAAPAPAPSATQKK